MQFPALRKSNFILESTEITMTFFLIVDKNPNETAFHFDNENNSGSRYKFFRSLVSERMDINRNKENYGAK